MGHLSSWLFADKKKNIKKFLSVPPVEEYQLRLKVKSAKTGEEFDIAIPSEQLPKVLGPLGLKMCHDGALRRKEDLSNRGRIKKQYNIDVENNDIPCIQPEVGYAMYDFFHKRGLAKDCEFNEIPLWVIQELKAECTMASLSVFLGNYCWDDTYEAQQIFDFINKMGTGDDMIYVYYPWN